MTTSRRSCSCMRRAAATNLRSVDTEAHELGVCFFLHLQAAVHEHDKLFRTFPLIGSFSSQLCIINSALCSNTSRDMLSVHVTCRSGEKTEYPTLERSIRAHIEAVACFRQK